MLSCAGCLAPLYDPGFLPAFVGEWRCSVLVLLHTTPPHTHAHVKTHGLLLLCHGFCSAPPPRPPGPPCRRYSASRPPPPCLPQAPPAQNVDAPFLALAQAFQRNYEEKATAFEEACRNF